MFVNSQSRLFALGFALLLFAGACGSGEGDTSAVTSDPADSATTETTDGESVDTILDDESADGDATAMAGTVDVGLFFDGALATEVTTEDCALSGGAETSCYVITVAGDPVTYDTGPFCPETITDSADSGGIWFDGDGVYDIDGEFIVNLAELYGDDNWMMYDEDGNVLVTETAEEFDLAARPDVDPSLQNHCVEGRLEWLENGEPISTTVTIPVEPVLADAVSSAQGNLGVTLDGVVIAASAPVEAILGAYTIAAFDDCGGHFNPFDGYHLHGAVGCSELDEAAEGETAMFAYAMDGFPVHSPLDDVDSADLDECNGHTTEEDGYHYHANNAAENQVIECLIGQTVAGSDAAGGGGAGGRPEGPPPGEG
ncbi:MAG: YHYH protein [Acidimicrobiales bacterium]|nr:YHYH protein [Acidimicrobiales bacterium]